jgi:hypothetical protein
MSHRKSSKRQNRAQVVGFYKDHGKTKPITKSASQLSRRKVIRGGHGFKAVIPKEDRRKDVAQTLENLMEKLAVAQNSIQTLELQKHQMQERRLETDAIDREIERRKEEALLVNNKVRELG